MIPNFTRECVDIFKALEIHSNLREAKLLDNWRISITKLLKLQSSHPSIVLTTFKKSGKNKIWSSWNSLALAKAKMTAIYLLPCCKRKILLSLTFLYFLFFEIISNGERRLGRVWKWPECQREDNRMKGYNNQSWTFVGPIELDCKGSPLAGVGFLSLDGHYQEVRTLLIEL